MKTMPRQYPPPPPNEETYTDSGGCFAVVVALFAVIMFLCFLK